jgi:hypothetical protein
MPRGNACSNNINVPVRVVQDVMISGIREDLDNPVLVKEFEARAKAALREPAAKPDNGKRIAQLRQEVTNLTDAIASGMLRASPALGQRLQAAEDELQRLAQQPVVRPVTRLVPDLRKEFRELAQGIDEVLLHDPERGREKLRSVLDGKIKLQPDKSRRFLIADYGLGLELLLQKTASAEIMVAGARFGRYLQGGPDARKLRKCRYLGGACPLTFAVSYQHAGAMAHPEWADPATLLRKRQGRLESPSSYVRSCGRPRSRGRCGGLRTFYPCPDRTPRAAARE